MRTRRVRTVFRVTIDPEIAARLCVYVAGGKVPHANEEASRAWLDRRAPKVAAPNP
jgi:uncharacterized protein with von Willebrand factor type A (vWA) domain